MILPQFRVHVIANVVVGALNAALALASWEHARYGFAAVSFVSSLLASAAIAILVHVSRVSHRGPL
ncbi:MAG: hypothetical protein NVS1B2_15910 [Vulcanimicrobiaceae bacterium]